MRYYFLFLIAFSILCMNIGCSGSSRNSTNPESPSIPQAESNPAKTEIIYSGTFEIDMSNMSIKNTENRIPDYVYNITGFLAGGCPGGCFRFRILRIIGTVIEIELTIENPSKIQVYDVRLAYTNLFGKTVLNPDSYTDFLGAPITKIYPFTAFMKERDDRAFPPGPGSTDTEILLLDFPPGSIAAVNYVATASFPSNCGEPYGISDMKQTGTLTTSGGSAIISCRVDDHQSDVSRVDLDARPFTGTAIRMMPSAVADYFEANISNTEGAPVGTYIQLIMAQSPNPQNIRTYNYVEITVSEETTGSYWPQFQHDPTHAGRTDVVGPQTNHVAWSYDGPGSNALLAIEGYDGTIYYGTVGNGGIVSAVNPDGSEKWIYHPSVSSDWNKPLGVTPDDSVVYCGLNTGFFEGRVSGVDTETGEELWITSYMYSVSSNTYGLILENGDLVVSGEDDGSYNTKRFDKNGNQVWRTQTDWNWCTAPAQGQNGIIYVKSGFELWGLKPDDGSKVYFVNFSEASLNTQACLAVRSDNSVIFAGNLNNDTKVWCFNAELNKKWDLMCGTGIPIDGFGIGPNDEIYFTVMTTDFQYKMFAIAPDGTHTMWEYPNAMHWSTPVVDKNGTIYCGLTNGIAAINPDGSTKWTYTGPGYAAAPVLSHDGCLYANMFGDLYKFADL